MFVIWNSSAPRYVSLRIDNGPNSSDQLGYPVSVPLASRSHQGLVKGFAASFIGAARQTSRGASSSAQKFALTGAALRLRYP